MTTPALTDEELARYHQAIVRQLFDFDDFCREHDIEYMLSFGSLLGAVRHKGLIPWDDDIDIMMMEEEFQKLLAAPLPEYLEIDRTNITKLNDKRFHYARAPKLDEWKPVFIDIFVLKETGPAAEMLTKLLLWVNARHKLPKGHPVRILKSIIKYPLKPIRHLLRWCADHQSQKSRIRYTHHLYQDFSFNKTAMMPISRTLDFCGRNMPGPAHPEHYLSIQYGTDYLIPTPPSLRRFRINRIDF